MAVVKVIDLEGYKALITASTRGIGRGIAEVLLSSGARVFINGIHEASLTRALTSLRSKYGGRVNGLRADLRRADEIKKLVNRAVEFLGGLDSLIYVTGPPKAGFFKELAINDWIDGVNLLIMSAVNLVREALPNLQRSEKASIVFSTSVAVKEPIPNIALSNTLRISVHGLMKTLARELGPEGIRVNAVMPGYVMTDRVMHLAMDRARRSGKSLDEVIREISSEIPLGRIAKPEEIGYVVAFLISKYASYVNGVSIPVDGGLLRSQL